MPFGRSKRLQRAVGRIYLLLTKEAARAPNVDHLDDFRAAQEVEKSITSAPKRRAGIGPAKAKGRRRIADGATAPRFVGQPVGWVELLAKPITVRTGWVSLRSTHPCISTTC